jgi:hypothetical protein
VWKVKRFSGQAEHSLRAEVTLVSTTKERKPWARPPISMNFQVRCRTPGWLADMAAVLAQLIIRSPLEHQKPS